MPLPTPLAPLADASADAASDLADLLAIGGGVDIVEVTTTTPTCEAPWCHPGAPAEVAATFGDNRLRLCLAHGEEAEGYGMTVTDLDGQPI
jgi:hypothetical protein